MLSPQYILPLSDELVAWAEPGGPGEALQAR